MYLRRHISLGQECFLFVSISYIARRVPGKHLMDVFKANEKQCINETIKHEQYKEQMF